MSSLESGTDQYIHVSRTINAFCTLDHLITYRARRRRRSTVSKGSGRLPFWLSQSADSLNRTFKRVQGVAEEVIARFNPFKALRFWQTLEKFLERRLGEGWTKETARMKKWLAR